LLGLGASGGGEKRTFFFEYEYEGWKILVGRNSRNNDELTFGHSHKEDLWLHARDVPGSHVIVQRKGKDFPKHVLEHAAGIAAHYSKRKGEALVPVQYTLRTYVRKLRGGAPGQVTLEREQVVLVEPMRK
jgi:predicted ribosome quality control (RQC) complex YloA/Tae2 family protein